MMRGASQIDLDATAKRCFKDKRSCVFLDGREILFGADWDRRKREVYARDKGFCYFCGGRTMQIADAHHLNKRSIRRDDRMDNLATACRACHDAQHPEKQPHWSVPV